MPGAAPACATPMGELGLPMEVAPASTPVVAALGTSVAAVPPVPESGTTGRGASVMPLLSASELQLDEAKPSMSTMHRAVRPRVPSIDIAQDISRQR